MMMNCSRAAETDAPVCERAHAHVQDDSRRKKQGTQPCRCGEGKRDGGGGEEERHVSLEVDTGGEREGATREMDKEGLGRGRVQ